jgi:hypothetical protein
MRKILALCLSVTAFALVAVGAQARSSAPVAMMHGIGITGFKVNADHTVTVNVKVRNWKMYPQSIGKKPNKADGGHWHILVNGKYNNASASPTTGKTTPLKKGDYKIKVVLANNDHSPVKESDPSKTISVMIDG